MTFWDRDRKITTAKPDIVSIHLTFSERAKMKKIKEIIHILIGQKFKFFWRKHEKKPMTDLVNKRLVGKKILQGWVVEPKRNRRIHGWDQQPCEISWRMELF